MPELDRRKLMAGREYVGASRIDGPLVFVRGELYASAAWAGALVLVGLQAFGVSPVIAAWSGMASVLCVRLLSMAFRITLPIYSERK